MQTIDEAIKSRFKSPAQRAAINLVYTANIFTDRVNAVLKPHGLSHPQYNILRILRGSSPTPLSIKSIRERMLDRSSDVSRIVDKMVSKGLINRCPCPNDRRNVNVTISEQGLALLSQMDCVVNASDEILAAFSEEELAQLSDFLDRLRAQLEQS